ncbi:MAG: hypothetical protein PHS62_01770 [Patescibacteria group bacterium]|nr:hypothetical protein [Patescibacteria group bacterium]
MKEIRLEEPKKADVKITNIDELYNSPDVVALKDKIEKITKERKLLWYKGLKIEEWNKKVEKLNKKFGASLGTLEFMHHMAKNKAVGLSPNMLLKRWQDLKNFWEEPKGSQVKTCYVPDIALIHTLLGEDLSGRTIVEVGPGREGVAILAYLASRGAKTIAIDVEHPGDDFLKKYPNVEFINDSWENIEECMKGRKADVIYTHNMHPNPEGGGRFENSKEDFEKHVSEAMDRVLVPGGAYIGHHVEADYVLSYAEDFIKTKGYKTNSFSSPLGSRDYMDDMKREISPKGSIEFSETEVLEKLEESSKKAPFYGYIKVVQKSAG